MLRSTLLTNGRLLRHIITRRSNSPLSLSTRLYTTKKENESSSLSTNTSSSPESTNEPTMSLSEVPLLVSKPVFSMDEATSTATIEPKLSLTFTCTASDCGERSTHLFTRLAYRKGVVIVQCPGCKNRYVFQKKKTLIIIIIPKPKKSDSQDFLSSDT